MSALYFFPSSSHASTEHYLEDLALDPTMDDCTDYEYDEYFIEDGIEDEVDL